MKKQELIDHVEAIAVKLAEGFGYEIVDVDYVKEGPNWYLKVFADKQGGFSINDCVALSHALEEKLEENDPIENAYILEVSSPGLDRPLKKDKDFIRSIGKLVDIKLFETKEGISEKSFTALLRAFDPDKGTVTLELEDGKEIELARKELAGIRLAVVF
ncbi:MAG: ribosome maturation factor RimP [Firmicutes bacterium]|nr:ribosome maturation factor RimP [Bacillota bacterium]